MGYSGQIHLIFAGLNSQNLVSPMYNDGKASTKPWYASFNDINMYRTCSVVLELSPLALPVDCFVWNGDTEDMVVQGNLCSACFFLILKFLTLTLSATL